MISSPVRFQPASLWREIGTGSIYSHKLGSSGSLLKQKYDVSADVSNLLRVRGAELSHKMLSCIFQQIT